MDKRQKELIIAPLVVIIAASMVFFTVKKVIRSRPRRVQGVPTEILEKPDISDEVLRPPLEELVSYTGLAEDTSAKKEKASVYNVGDSPWGRDPFLLDKAGLFDSQDKNWVLKLDQLSKLRLTGMIISQGRPEDSIAVINDENLKVGEIIFGFIIKEIRSNFVVLESGGEKFVLRLWEEEESEKKKGLIKPP